MNRGEVEKVKKTHGNSVPAPSLRQHNNEDSYLYFSPLKYYYNERLAES
jgi:hypothetical protein